MRRMNYMQRTLSLRLIRLIDQRHRQEKVMTDVCIRMFDNAINATYLDCLDAGCADHVAPFYAAYQQRQERTR